MAGVILIHETLAIGAALDDLEVVISAGNRDDFKDRVTFIPLR